MKQPEIIQNWHDSALATPAVTPRHLIFPTVQPKRKHVSAVHTARHSPVTFDRTRSLRPEFLRPGIFFQAWPFSVLIRALEDVY